MSTVWRLHTNTDSDTGERVADICLKDNVLAMGWSLNDNQIKKCSDEVKDLIRRKRKEIITYEDYCFCYSKIWDDNITSNIIRLREEVAVNDLIWIRNNGHYYLGRVCENSKWKYVSDDFYLNKDASSQRDGIEWHLVGDESDIPGTIAKTMIGGWTFSRINDENVRRYSEYVYNQIVGNEYYPLDMIEKNADSFYSLVSTEDCEDLLCMWLYYKYGYIVIPSTNKKSTELYECVLKDPKTGKNIYPQVKDGDVNLDGNDYKHLDGEVWLFSTKGKVTNVDQKQVFRADPKELFDFVDSGVGNFYLPQSILKWYKMMV